MNKLPEGWEIKKLGEVCKIVYGKGLPVKQLKEDGYPVFGANGIIGFNDRYLYEDSEVLISCRGAYSGKINLSPPRCYVTNNSLILKISNQKVLDKKYLFYALHTVNKSKLITGTAQPQVTINNAVELSFPLPPLPVQHAIVTKIEEIFSELDHGVEQLKTARQQLKVYRQAVLNSVIIGEAEHTIESVIESLDQGWSPKCYNEPSRNKDEWAVIKTTAVQAGYYQEEENKRLPEDLAPRKQHELKKGDLLITRAGPRVRVGICCLVKKTRPKLLNCDKVYRMRINPELAIPEYVEMLLNSPRYSKEIEKMKTGISDSGVNLTQKGFLKILIPLPSLSEQHRIVSEIERRLSVCDKLEETIERSLKAAEVLRAGVLKRAFEGRLVGS